MIRPKLSILATREMSRHCHDRDYTVIELDKARWHRAWRWLQKLPHDEIRKRLDAIADTEEREDMRLRLNIIYRGNAD